MDLIEQMDREIKRHQHACEVLRIAKKILVEQRTDIPTNVVPKPRSAPRKLSARQTAALAIIKATPGATIRQVADGLLDQKVIGGKYHTSQASQILIELLRRRRVSRTRTGHIYHYHPV